LIRQLERRFGRLSPEASRRIEQADLTTIEERALRILEAGSLDEVIF
jgi:hypothetical protein